MRASAIPYRKMLAAVMLFITVSVFVLNGPFGLLVLFACTFTGISCALLGLKRTHLMGFLILPTVLYFSGVNMLLLSILGL
jgi:TctA family transporter